ncbi:MAG: hypothetical protein AB7E95_09675 [Kiritimatiellales bacterium]
MKTFLGIGLGPIQTGIFLNGAFRGNFDRLVIAEVDAALVEAVRENCGTIQINIASTIAVTTETITGVEIYNPTVLDDREKLVDVAAEADEVATALPSVNFFKYLDWVRDGFSRQSERRRFVYAAENHNHAAEALGEVLGFFPYTNYLNTVVGKMSCIFPADECRSRGIQTLTPSADRGHLVEKFNRIFIQACVGIEQRRTQGLYEKNDLYPFEEAKLYGHNAVHFLLAALGRQAGCACMNELSNHLDLLEIARHAFIDESGAALCRKWKGVDELFTFRGFSTYAEDLLVRMTNPFLADAVDRVARDLPRKMSWNDRVIGTIRLVLSQGLSPRNFSRGAAWAAHELFGDDPAEIRCGLQSLWPEPRPEEHERVLEWVFQSDRGGFV